MNDSHQAVLGALRAAPEAVSAVEVHLTTGVDLVECYDTLDALVEAGLARRPARKAARYKTWEIEPANGAAASTNEVAA